MVYNDFTSSYSKLIVKSGIPYFYVSRLKQLMLQVYESLLGPPVQKYIKQLFWSKD